MTPALAPAPARSSVDGARITLTMRIALGLLHAGALYRQPNGHWASRQYPQQRVADQTARAIEAQGLALLQEYEGLHGARRACLVVTPDGRRVYKGGALSGRTAPPVAAEAVLVEVEAALRQLDAEAKQDGAELAQIARRREAAHKLLREATQRLAALDHRIGRMETRLDAREASRADLRCFVAHAGERLCATLAETGR